MLSTKTFTLKSRLLLLALVLLSAIKGYSQQTRSVADFDRDWRFHLGDVSDGQEVSTTDNNWRKLNLPHDWSIEGEFSKDNPATPEGGALPGGIGWYRKTFTIPAASKGKEVYIDFDGVYQKSDVWVNGHHLGFRPNGYISFRYELTPYLKYGQPNVIAVKVDNSSQPNSRWYSGSGIYRNVWLVTTNKVAIDHWGTFISTPKVSKNEATVNMQVKLHNASGKPQQATVTTAIYDAAGKLLKTVTNNVNIVDSSATATQQAKVLAPMLWSDVHPYLYKAITKVSLGKTLTDIYTTNFGIRYFDFDVDKGFSINGVSVKLRGVCDHHDLGSLGAAINYRALQRQLEILKDMGCNAIRTSHNPPAPELLDLCDKMGFFVMDEAFDVWERAKKKYDYSLFFKEWHKRDLEDQILRDRNHPSVIVWSIGNEIPEQRRPIAADIAKELAGIIHNLDRTRPITTANNNPDTSNKIISSGAIDLAGYNYHYKDYPTFQQRYPGKKFIGTETTSALETRGYYDMPPNIDSIRRWPVKNNYNDHVNMNPDNTVSAYDNVSAPWASTHEESWKPIKKYPFLSGMFIWTGFDYLGEPTPYTWPSRSSYFGIIDLAGFPKDVYYMYQSEWTDKTVLHLLPHWNWQTGKTIQVWAYYNHADEVELFLNGKSLGKKAKKGDDLHISWAVPFQPGTLKAISYKDGKTVKVAEIHTAGKPAKIELVADRKTINADGKDLSFITVKILDKDGNLVPNADNKVDFKVNGSAFIASVDNGDPVSHDPFKANYRKAFHGLALAILQSNEKAGNITFTATADGLAPAVLTLQAK
ncbi:beta-galactosidase GalB [Mucilaginibacter boryungensis]|uniref:Glycoside hydrolase family 2 protein n=2 Tax=Mucilaginibacter boryungensis TaxID=768480 RepID=A0ABR9XJ69_9SPHI|nr:beta-galactosidase GalB [Mucilaginibacter boryungensis]MBE9667252.1 glycoside hydrolase family 2 protein [Mucilaginibacter boryungensis]